MNIRIATAGAVLAMSIGLSSAGAQATQTVDVRVQGPNDTYLAIEVLKTVTVQNEYSRGYQRSLFKHWLDVDGDGCDAREQVLKRDAIGLPQVDPFKCFVVEADWLSPYDGVRTSDRTRVDIDHTVALKEAWDSGAWQWNEAQRTAFANDTSDTRSLIAASSSSNRSKGDRDPSNWMPPLRGYWCTYSANWIAVKARWGLSMDQSEWGRLNNVLSGQCAGTTMRGWSDVVAGAPATAPATSPLTVPTTVSSTGPSTTGPTAGRSTATTTVTTVTTVASASTSTTVAPGGSPVVASLRPGSFCAPEGATGVYNGRMYVCSKTDMNGTPYTGNRARWRQQT
jgi:hypothetical protein